MAGKDMTLRMVMKLAANEFTRGISAIQKQIQGLGNYMKTAFAVGSVVSFGREMVKWTKEFEDSMARAKAVSNATADGFRFMRDEALRLGATTRYTSVQVAQTLEVLTRNGLSATNATRILADTLRLAQANAVDLADAGNMITNTINMFGLSVKDAAYVTDILSATASNSATDLTSLYEAMTNAAPMAHALSMDIEEVAAALGALANVGVKGPDAGTQLRQFLQRLTDPLAMKKMQKLTGFSFDEDFIKTEGLEGVLKKLQSLNLSVSQLNEIFTVRSSKSIIQLMNSMRNFTALVKVMEESEGTAFRMFTEGVGTMRYELDILRSMWQNWLIEIGSNTEGVFLGLVRSAQNAITMIKQLGSSFASIFKPDSFKNWGASLLLILSQVGVAYAAFHNKINAFYKSMAASAKAWANQSAIASKIASKEHLKSVYERLIANGQLSASEEKLAKQRIAAIQKSINGYKAQQKAAQALKATLATMGWTALIVGAEVLITKLVALNAEVREANKAVAEARSEGQRLMSHVEMLKGMIDKGGDSLTAAVREAKRTFSEFATAIQLAADEAGNTGNYTRLKQLLTDIANLQAQIMANKALQGRKDATLERFAKSIKANQGAESQAIKRVLKENNYTGGLLDAAYHDIAEILVDSAGDFGRQVSQLGDYFNRLGIKISDEILRKFVSQNTPQYQAAPGPGGNGGRVSYYSQAVDARKSAEESTTGMSKRESEIKWQNAIDEYNRAAAEAAKKYKEGTTQYREAMVGAYNNLKNSLGDMVTELRNGVDWWSRTYQEIERKWGGRESSSYTGGGEGGSTSKKKTTQDKFNDIVKDYIDDSKKLEEQYNNGILTQEQYRKALSDVELEALKTIGGVADLDKMLKGLPKSSKEAGNSLAGMLKDFNQKAAENILLGFDEKQAEINTKYENSPKGTEDLKEFNDSMDDLAAETMDELQKIQDLNEILDKLNPRMKDLYELLNFGVTSNREIAKSKQLEELDKDTKIDVKEPELTVILSPDDNSVEGIKQQLQRELDEENFEINVQMENDDKVLDATKDKIKAVEKAIETTQEKLDKGDYDLIKEEALKRLETLKKYLIELMKQAKNLEDKVLISKWLAKVNDDIKKLSESSLDNISSMASAFDRLKDSVKDIAEAFDMDIEFEGLEKGITVINAVIQAIESVKEIMETFQAFQELVKKKQVASNAQLALSNLSVAASERVKAAASGTSAKAGNILGAISEALTAANKKEASSNLLVAATAGTKAAASGTAAAAEGAESVADIPYVGPILAVAAAASIAAALIAAFSKIKGFANGGIVGGNSFSGDRNLIRANSGEMVLTRGHQRTLWNAIQSGNLGGGGKVEFVIKGDQLVGTLANYNRIHR